MEDVLGDERVLPLAVSGSERLGDQVFPPAASAAVRLAEKRPRDEPDSETQEEEFAGRVRQQEIELLESCRLALAGSQAQFNHC